MITANPLRPAPSASPPRAGQVRSGGLLSATVRVHQAMAGASQQAAGAARAVAARMDVRNDTGAQAAEYAMLSGVGVAIAGACIALLRNGDLIRTLVAALVDVLVAFVQSWFGG